MVSATAVGERSDQEYLVLGRILMDQGFRDLFRCDPHRAVAQLEVSLPAEALHRIQSHLAKMDAMDGPTRGLFTSRLNAVERWKQA